MDLFSVRIFIPLFSVRYFEAWGVRVSTRLPPPRTVLGALARGLGISLNIASGEKYIGEKPARIILTEVIERSSYAFVRPLSPLVKTSQILRIVPGIEQAKEIHIAKASIAHDAFKHDVIFSNEMETVYAIDFVKLNKELDECGLKKASAEDIILALRMIDRIGPTEAFCHVLNVERVEPRIVDPPATINSYTPAAWVEPLHQGEQNYLIESLYPNLRILEHILGKHFSFEQSRKERVNFILPITCRERRRGREIFENSEVLVKPMGGYSIYSLAKDEHPTKVVLPENEMV